MAANIEREEESLFQIMQSLHFQKGIIGDDII